jgi:hypothetical protein
MNAQFARITTLGLLEMDKVRGVNKMTIGGSEQFEFMGNLLTDYKPLLENSGVHHDRRGLLTRKQLTSTPEFSITTLQVCTNNKCLLIFGRYLEGCFSMLSMCVLTSIYPLRSIDLVLSPILFSTAYQPNIILIKTMYHPNTLAGTSDERRPGGRAGQLPLRVWRGGERL